MLIPRGILMCLSKQSWLADAQPPLWMAQEQELLFMTMKTMMMRMVMVMVAMVSRLTVPA